jgi:hypothetical protein
MSGDGLGLPPATREPTSHSGVPAAGDRVRYLVDHETLVELGRRGMGIVY